MFRVQIPPTFRVVIDMRNAPHRTEHEVRAQMEGWCRAAGAGVRYEIRIGRYVEPRASAVIDPRSQAESAERLADRFWHTFSSALGVSLELFVCNPILGMRRIQDFGSGALTGSKKFLDPMPELDLSHPL